MKEPSLPVSYSSPDQPVRHHYPLNIKNDSLGTAFGLCLKTSPYILMRLGILLGFTFLSLLWLALCGGIAALFSKNGGSGGIILFLIGVGIPGGLFAFLRSYLLDILKAGHIAVLTRLMTEGKMPEGVNQVEYGKNIVKAKFLQTNIMFVVNSMVNGVIQAFNRTLDWVAGLIPLPGLEGMMKVLNKIIDRSASYVDETIFSYNMARNDENIWRSSMDGLVYYAQNVKPILKTAVYSVILEYVITFVIFLLCLVPAYLVSLILPASVGSFAWILGVILAMIVKTSVLHPLFLTMVSLTFHLQAHEQPINEQYASTLDSVSDKFREMKEKAVEWMGQKNIPSVETANQSPSPVN